MKGGALVGGLTVELITKEEEEKLCLHGQFVRNVIKKLNI